MMTAAIASARGGRGGPMPVLEGGATIASPRLSSSDTGTHALSGPHTLVEAKATPAKDTVHPGRKSSMKVSRPRATATRWPRLSITRIAARRTPIFGPDWAVRVVWPEARCPLRLRRADTASGRVREIGAGRCRTLRRRCRRLQLSRRRTDCGSS